MFFHIGKPSPLLKQYVKSYWMIENTLPVGKNHTQRIVPTGLFELSFYLADKPTPLQTNKQFSDSAMLTGHSNSFLTFRLPESYRSFLFISIHMDFRCLWIYRSLNFMILLLL
ncbi:MAG: hypothetical protein PF489_14410 [Salinivirgaceae bacterium]|jgi:hypothetical protein|nr:hypothetical protein [Salinivirgaceae bacterium]